MIVQCSAMGNCLSCLFGLFQGNRGEYRSVPSSDSPIEYKPREVSVPPLPATTHHQVKHVKQPADSAPIGIPSTNAEVGNSKDCTGSCNCIAGKR